jgi:PAS domain S-box-containing protein
MAIRGTVNTIPSHDAVLRRVVDDLTRTQEPDTPEELADLLRPVFPRVAVFERLVSGERQNLYVYRDGRYEPERRDAWWENPDAPCIHVSTVDGRLLSVSGAWAGLMGSSESDLVGRHFLEFVQPEARPAALAMFDVLGGEREVRSEAVVVRPDGTSIPIEFRAIHTDDDIEVCYRPLAR